MRLLSQRERLLLLGPLPWLLLLDNSNWGLLLIDKSHIVGCWACTIHYNGLSTSICLEIIIIDFYSLIFYFSIVWIVYFSLLSYLWVFNTFSTLNFYLRSQAHTLSVDWILCLGITLRLCIILRVCCHNYLALFSSHCSNIFTDLLNLVIKGFLFLQISDFVFVSLWLEVKSLFIIKCLPFLSNLLHHLKCTHFWMCLYNKRTGFLDKNHVSWKTFFRLFQKIAVRF